ncbi:MAG: GTP cyclohydrolase I, partial [Thaumarchaeota archaeon]|nr:GTP cyclohydrolase I [Nitrososphaerota archaeon]
RLQIQERITKDIADELYSEGVTGVIVLIEGEHFCMKMRGVKNDARMTTIAYRGIYEKKESREDILALIRNTGSQRKII